MVDGQFSSWSHRLNVVLVSVAMACGLLGTHPNVAIGIPHSYQAGVFLSVSTAPGLLPFGTSLTLFSGAAFTPPPFAKFNASATNSAIANVPGQLRVGASGAALGPPGGLGEQNTESFAASSATAIGFGSLLNNVFGHPPVAFPLVVHEDWRVAAEGSGVANIRFQVLFDGTVIHEGAATADGLHPGFANSASVPLTVTLDPGFHSLVFTAQADGLASTPEPATLLLVGTTAAGLGLARWRQHRRARRS